MKKKILISSCLLGTPCRYDGKAKRCEMACKLAETFDLIPICPEVMGGLETPRLPCEICGGQVMRKDGKDMTIPYKKGAEAVLAIAKREDCRIAVLKEKSPSCASHLRYDGTFRGKLTEGQGITAKLLSENGICVYSEEQIHQIPHPKT